MKVRGAIGTTDMLYLLVADAAAAGIFRWAYKIYMNRSGKRPSCCFVLCMCSTYRWSQPLHNHVTSLFIGSGAKEPDHCHLGYLVFFYRRIICFTQSLLILILISSKNTFTVLTRCVWAGVWRLWFSQVDIKLTITPSLIPISSFELVDVTLPSWNHMFVDFFPSLIPDLKGRYSASFIFVVLTNSSCPEGMQLKEPSNSIMSGRDSANA